MKNFCVTIVIVIVSLREKTNLASVASTLASLFTELKTWRLSFFILLMMVSNINAQEIQNATSWAKENIQFSGYVKYLNTSQFRNLDAIINDNLLHNRLNLKVYLNKHFTTSIEVRNRVFWGNSVQLNPNYAQLVDINSQYIDLSAFLVEEPALLVLSKIDRLNINYQSDKWNITLGRQRINWGKNLVWNPNDLFNAYSFVDFDYEERPGTDALLVQYYISGSSSIETAINYTDDFQDNTFALKYNFNKYNYDFQILASKYIRDYMLGLGWEGNIKDLGFKGEMSYFIPKKQTEIQKEALVASISFDYYFKNGLSLNVAGLYNSLGISNTENFDLSQFNSIQLNAKQFMPNKTSFFIQLSKPITPAFTSSFSTIYATELNGIFMMPQLSYNISQNWGFDTTAQVFYGKQNDEISNVGNSVFLRFRWSF